MSKHKGIQDKVYNGPTYSLSLWGRAKKHYIHTYDERGEEECARYKNWRLDYFRSVLNKTGTRDFKVE